MTHLCHVGLRVPDPEAAAAFYQQVLGLGVTGREPATGAIRLSTLPPGAAVVSHHEVVLYPGGSGVDHLALGMIDDGALEAAVGRLRRQGAAVTGPQELGSAHGPSARVEDPDGLIVELTVPRPPVPRPAGDPAYDLIKLGHITRMSPNPPRQAAWWQDLMGFRLSDRMGENFYWLRCNRDHHTVAFVRAASPGTHHIALEVSSWAEMRRLGDHFAGCGVRIEFGPGRHGVGDNLFVYVLDPWGIRWEIFCEMIRVDDEAGHRAGSWDSEQRTATVNRWGPMPPASFLS